MAVVLAGPTFFLAGRLIRKRWRAQALHLAIGVCGVNLLVALPITFAAAAQDLTYQVLMVILTSVLVATGMYFGTRNTTA